MVPQVKWSVVWVQHECFWHLVDGKAGSLTKGDQISGTSQPLPCREGSLPGPVLATSPFSLLGAKAQSPWGSEHPNQPGAGGAQERQGEAAGRGRHRGGCERTDRHTADSTYRHTADSTYRFLMGSCARVHVGVRERDLRGGWGVTSSHSMNQHVLVCGRATEGARSPSNGVRAWKWHRWTKNYHRAQRREKNRKERKTEPPLCFLYTVF